MRVRCFIIVIMVLMMSQIGASRAEAFIFIHEFLADPASDLDGDANNDGTRDSYDDEFVELFNLSSETVDVSGWTIEDAVSVRYSFLSDTSIQPNSAFVVFGGGSPNLPLDINWQALTTGNLNLNNGGDTITLRDAGGLLIDFYTYGSEGGDNQSMTRNPEGSKGSFIKHTTLPNADGKLFSPGYLVNDIPSQSTVPEPATALYLAFGLSSLFLVRKK